MQKGRIPAGFPERLMSYEKLDDHTYAILFMEHRVFTITTRGVEYWETPVDHMEGIVRTIAMLLDKDYTKILTHEIMDRGIEQFKAEFEADKDKIKARYGAQWGAKVKKNGNNDSPDTAATPA